MALLLEGATPLEVDQVLRKFGMPMGSFELQDMTGGIELRYRRRLEDGSEDLLGDMMFSQGRLGQKSGKGYYAYKTGSRTPVPDADFMSLLLDASRAAGIKRRAITPAEIEQRLFLVMVNEASRIIEEGIVSKPSDIDVVWLHGYGSPDWRGGVVYMADQMSLPIVEKDLDQLYEKFGEDFRPSQLIRHLSQQGGRCLEQIE